MKAFFVPCHPVLQLGSIRCEHNVRWQYLSQMKMCHFSQLHFFLPIKTRQAISGTTAATYKVMAPHSNRYQRDFKGLFSRVFRCISVVASSLIFGFWWHKKIFFNKTEILVGHLIHRRHLLILLLSHHQLRWESWWSHARVTNKGRRKKVENRLFWTSTETFSILF